MKKIPLYAAILLLAACNSPKGENTEAGEKQNVAATDGTPYILDSTSIINWAASKPTATHRGTFLLKEGSFMVKDNNLTAGNFTIDIASIKDTDLTVKDGKEKLEGHLKSKDFFNVAKYPTAKFEITMVEPSVIDSTSNMKDATHIIRGNLTLKDSTKNISFPARVTIDARSLTAKADFDIDRTMWGMNYKGPGNPQNWFISKQVNLKLDLSASKK